MFATNVASSPAIIILTETPFVRKKPIDIENDSLAWSINACSSINNVERAKFIITVIQNKKDIWKKESSRIVPKCSDGKHLKFGNHLVFKHLISENTSTSELWKDTE